MANLGEVSSLHVTNRFEELRVDLGHLGLFQVVTSKVVVLPGRRLVDHGQRSLELQV